MGESCEKKNRSRIVTTIKINIPRRLLIFRWVKSLLLDVPGTMAELPMQLRLPSVKILMDYQSTDAKLQLLHLWTNLKTNTIAQIPSEQLTQLTNLLDWFQLSPNDVPFIDFFDWKGVRYYLPTAHFENGKAIEYPIADDFYNNFVETEEKKHLICLVATICRPINHDPQEIITNGDRRINLNSRDEALHRAEALEGLPDEILMAVKLYFEGVKLYVSETYGHWLFPKTEQTDEDTGGLNFGWWGAYQNAAEANVFGNLEQVYQTRFHTVCVWMIRKKDAADQREQQQNFQTAKEESNGE